MRRLSRQTFPWILALGTLATLPCGVARAQGGIQRETTEESAAQADRRKLESTLAGMRDRPDPEQPDSDRDPVAPPEPPDAALRDPATRNAYLTSMQEYYRYRTSGFMHRRVLFEWQHWSSQVIFAVVLALVAVGIYFAAVQFHLGLRPKRKAQRSEEGADSTELVATVQGIRVRSPVLGVIILVISMAFFYMYLAFVYPIQEVL